MLKYWMAKPKKTNNLRVLMMGGKIVYSIKGPLGTRLYESGPYTRESALRDYQSALSRRFAANA